MVEYAIGLKCFSCMKLRKLGFSFLSREKVKRKFSGCDEMIRSVSGVD